MTILRLAIGLGNPGDEYRGTRHNVGFEVIDRVARSLTVRLTRFRGRGDAGKPLGHVAEDESRGFALLEPSTFMNRSGAAAAAAKERFGLQDNAILVVCDDFHLALGRIRARPKGSAGGHNGLRSLIASLTTDEFPRVRIGIGEASGPWEAHVLSRFEPQERLTIHKAVEAVSEAVSRWCLDGDLERLMNALNSLGAGEAAPRVNLDGGSKGAARDPEVRDGNDPGSPEPRPRGSGPIQKRQP
jgi:PTH1 family peptidyl-tRNA hydrolase